MNDALLSSKRLDWCTPADFFKELDQEFHFDLDPAATAKSAKCAEYFTPADDGLKANWGGRRVFCNPPYGRQICDWVRKGYEESQKPGTVVVMLIPARTDTAYFHDYIFGGKADEVRFLRGRLTFTDEDGNPTMDAKGRACSAPFPSAVIIWRSPDMGQSLRDMVLDLIKSEAMTANEIAATLSDRGQQVSRSDVGPILTKAQAAGKAKNAGKRVCSVTGAQQSSGVQKVRNNMELFDYSIVKVISEERLNRVVKVKMIRDFYDGKKEVVAGFFPAEWEAYKHKGQYPEIRALDEHAIAYYENMPDAEWYRSRHAAKLSDFTDEEIVAEFNARLACTLYHKIGIESRAIIKGDR